MDPRAGHVSHRAPDADAHALADADLRIGGADPDRRAARAPADGSRHLGRRTDPAGDTDAPRGRHP
ncbi:hypothetical protein ABZZ79_38665 [Streptomyces sp. NPDC006458]|uniref:hypothetical protein n=1 Tax=Streptomyces sp. NPDC006458 TaxID=3154302 RepID=UPI0033BF7DAA